MRERERRREVGVVERVKGGGEKRVREVKGEREREKDRERESE